MKRTLTLSLLVALSASATANASPTFYSDVNNFTSANPAAVQAPTVPNNGKVIDGTGTADLGDLQFKLESGATALFFGTDGLSLTDWSSAIDGNDVALSGGENFSLTVTSTDPFTSFGFTLHEPRENDGLATDSCNAPCKDSEFTFEAVTSSDGSQIETITPNGGSVFVGVSGAEFSSFTITETVGGIDNEYFGDFYFSREQGASAEVPVPGTFALIALALVTLGGICGRANTTHK